MNQQYTPLPPSTAPYQTAAMSLIMPEEISQHPEFHSVHATATQNIENYSNFNESNQNRVLPHDSNSRPHRKLSQRIENVKHRRTRSGCYTCRQRRIKCDESHPVCDRCRKGNRECTYPSMNPSSSKTSSNSIKEKGSPAASSLSGNEPEGEGTEFPSSLLVEDRSEHVEDGPQSASSKPGEAPTISADAADNNQPPTIPTSASSSGRNHAKPEPRRPPDGEDSVKQMILRNLRRTSLPSDVKFYLNFYRDELSPYHYAFRHNRRDFLRTIYLEIAMTEGTPGLIYAIVAFAVYHYSVKYNESKISEFLSYYNKAIVYLQQSLKSRRHTDATLLTILQLAAIEEFLGDWVNVLYHQKAALEILTSLYTPETIVQTETRLNIVTWYMRYDLLAKITLGDTTWLSREWYAACENHYKQRVRDKPDDVEAKFEELASTCRIRGADMSLLIAARMQNTISEENFAIEAVKLTSGIHEFGQKVATSFPPSSNFSVRYLPGFSQQHKEDTDTKNGKSQSSLLYDGELFTLNYLLMDYWSITLAFECQQSYVQSRQASPEMAEIAMKIMKLFDAIQHDPTRPPGALLACQSSLAISSFFLPRDEDLIMACRNRFALMEQHGYVYPDRLRGQLSERWKVDVRRWYVSEDEVVPDMIRDIRDFLEYRAAGPMDAQGKRIRDMCGIFLDFSSKRKRDGRDSTFELPDSAKPSTSSNSRLMSVSQ